MPFDTTTIIPAGWSKHHQHIVKGTSNARVVITDPARSTPGAFDPDTGRHGPTVPHYVVGGPGDDRPEWRDGVPCRLQQLRSDREVVAADQQVRSHQYLLQVPVEVPDVTTKLRVTVLAAHNDPQVVGITFKVDSVLHGSEQWSRDVLLAYFQTADTEG